MGGWNFETRNDCYENNTSAPISKLKLTIWQQQTLNCQLLYIEPIQRTKLI